MLPRLQLLASYAYLRDEGGRPAREFRENILALAPYVDVMVDSGAYTVATTKRRAALGLPARRGPPITLSAYIAFCRAIHGRVWQYLALDVIGDRPATSENLRQMVAAGLYPMPVVTTTTDLAEVPAMVAINSWLCVAGGPVMTHRWCCRRYHEVYEASGRQAQIHALGFVRWPDIARLPLRSGDSSSWQKGKQYGALTIFDDWRGTRGCTLPQLRRWASTGDRRADPFLGCAAEMGVGDAALLAPAAWRTTTGVASVLSVYGTLRMGEAMAGRGVGSFIVNTNNANLGHLLMAVAGYGRGRDAYPASVAMWQELQALHGQPERYRARAVDLVRARTAWQSPVLVEPMEEAIAR